MKIKTLLASVGLAFCALSVSATERFFTYTYEPETMPQGAMEYEQWIGLRAGRNKTVGQDNYNKWEIREEFEYGVTDNYSLSIYLNQSSENYRDPLTAEDHSNFHFDGVSLANGWMIINPTNHAGGLALYLDRPYAR